MQQDARVWVIRSKPHGHVRLREFLEGNLVAIGWPGLGDLRGANRDGIEGLLRTRPAYRLKPGGELTGSINTLDNFVNKISEVDYVVVPSPEGGPVYFGIVVGDYHYAVEKDSEEQGYPHQRGVRWLNTSRPVGRSELPQKLANMVRARQPLLEADSAEFMEWFKGKFGNESAGRQIANSADVDLDSDELRASSEGAVSTRLTKVAERDRKLRLQKIHQALETNGGKLRCEVPGCGFDFFQKYGVLGKDFAIVHHSNPLCGGVRETRLDDLSVVCANCHAMIHRGGGCRRLDGLIPRASP